MRSFLAEYYCEESLLSLYGYCEVFKRDAEREKSHMCQAHETTVSLTKKCIISKIPVKLTIDWFSHY